MPERSNIPSELRTAPMADLKFKKQDPETVRAVEDFIRQKSAEAGGGEPVADPAEPEDTIAQNPVQVPPNPEFDQISPQEAVLSDALATDPAVVVTDLDKELFLKSVLSDEPVRLQIELYGGQMKLSMRSRTTFEQRRVFDVIEKDREEKVVSQNNIAWMVTRMQQYLAVLMVERINNVVFSELKLDPKGTLADHTKQLREAVDDKLEGMVGIRWNSILSALRNFENKCAKLNTEALNEGFWKPQGSV